MPLSTSHARKAATYSALTGNALTPRLAHMPPPEYLEIAAVGPPRGRGLLLRPRSVALSRSGARAAGKLEPPGTKAVH
jgi:hypothetical protein